MLVETGDDDDNMVFRWRLVVRCGEIGRGMLEDLRGRGRTFTTPCSPCSLWSPCRFRGKVDGDDVGGNSDESSCRAVCSPAPNRPSSESICSVSESSLAPDFTADAASCCKAKDELCARAAMSPSAAPVRPSKASTRAC